MKKGHLLRVIVVTSLATGRGPTFWWFQIIFYFHLLRGKDPILICFRWVETTNKENQMSLVSFFLRGKTFCMKVVW